MICNYLSFQKTHTKLTPPAPVVQTIYNSKDYVPANILHLFESFIFAHLDDEHPRLFSFLSSGWNSIIKAKEDFDVPGVTFHNLRNIVGSRVFERLACCNFLDN